MKWPILLAACSLSCAFSSPQLHLLADECGDAEPGFAGRLAALASSVWTTSGASGAAQYVTIERGSGECSIDRAFYVQLEPSKGGYVGQVLAVAYDTCTKMDCSIAYQVEGR